MSPSIRTQKFKKDSSYRLIKIAKDDLYAASILATAPLARPETITYHIQQSVEKSLKSVLIFKGIAVPLTHDLEYLLSFLDENLTKGLPTGVGELTQFATIRRYVDGDELIEPSDIARLLEVGKLFNDWADLILNS